MWSLCGPWSDSPDILSPLINLYRRITGGQKQPLLLAKASIFFYNFFIFIFVFIFTIFLLCFCFILFSEFSLYSLYLYSFHVLLSHGVLLLLLLFFLLKLLLSLWLMGTLVLSDFQITPVKSGFTLYRLHWRSTGICSDINLGQLWASFSSLF